MIFIFVLIVVLHCMCFLFLLRCFFFFSCVDTVGKRTRGKKSFVAHNLNETRQNEKLYHDLRGANITEIIFRRSRQCEREDITRLFFFSVCVASRRKTREHYCLFISSAPGRLIKIYEPTSIGYAKQNCNLQNKDKKNIFLAINTT